MLIPLLQIIDLLLSVMLWVIIIQAILSWLVAFNVVNTHNDFVRQVLYALSRMTEPLYRPIRRVMPDFGALDALLEGVGAEGAAGPPGYVISQLLTQTS